MLWKALTVWVVLLVTAVLLGGLRQTFLEPPLGEQRAHQVGTITGCILFIALICAFTPWLGPSSRWQALGIGVLWLLLALAFEFGFFHFVRGLPWSQLLADYNLAGGRLLLLLWLTVLIAPVICFGLRDSPC